MGVSPRVVKNWKPGAQTQGSVWAQKMGAQAGQNARPSAVACARDYGLPCGYPCPLALGGQGTPLTFYRPVSGTKYPVQGTPLTQNPLYRRHWTKYPVQGTHPKKRIIKLAFPQKYQKSPNRFPLSRPRTKYPIQGGGGPMLSTARGVGTVDIFGGMTSFPNLHCRHED